MVSRTGSPPGAPPPSATSGGRPCPDCGGAARLQPSPSELAEQACRACGGALLDADAVVGLQLMLGESDRPGRAPVGPEPVPGGRSAACAACGAAAGRVKVGGMPGWSCTGCGALWMPSGGLFHVTGGRAGARPARAAARPATAASPPAAAPRRRAWVLAAAAALGAVCLVAGWWAMRSLPVAGRSPPAALPATVADPKSSVMVTPLLEAKPAAAPVPRPAAASAPDAAAPAAAAPPSQAPVRLAAGRTAGWWRDRLAMLKGRGDEEGQRLYALTRERAERNGLRVTEGPAGIEVEPRP